MRLARNIVLTIGTALLVLGAAASLQDPERGDALGLRLLPAVFFRLHRPFIGGGDYPASLSGAGIVAVYLLPGVLLLCLALVLQRGAHAGRKDQDHGA